MSKWRRYEVQLPLQFNDGKPVPEAWIGDAVLEIVDQFDAASLEPQIIEGRWRHEGTVYQDRLVKILIVVPDLAANRRWMKEFKSRWKKRLKQIELWMVSHPIRVE